MFKNLTRPQQNSAFFERDGPALRLLNILEHLDSFPSHFRPFSLIIGSLNQRVTDRQTDGQRDRRTDGPTDGGREGRTDPLIEMRGRI